MDVTQGAEDFRVRSWLADDASPHLSQVIYKFHDIAHAARDYKNAPNGRNYHVGDGLHAISVDTDGLRLGADATNVYCVQYSLNRKIAACGEWGYRGLYGRYVVDVIASKYLGRGKYLEIEKQVFLDMVVAIDKYVAGRATG